MFIRALKLFSLISFQVSLCFLVTLIYKDLPGWDSKMRFPFAANDMPQLLVGGLGYLLVFAFITQLIMMNYLLQTLKEARWRGVLGEREAVIIFYGTHVLVYGYMAFTYPVVFIVSLLFAALAALLVCAGLRLYVIKRGC